MATTCQFKYSEHWKCSKKSLPDMKQTSSKSFSLREKELALVALYPLVSLDWRLKCTKVKKPKKNSCYVGNTIWIVPILLWKYLEYVYNCNNSEIKCLALYSNSNSSQEQTKTTLQLPDSCKCKTNNTDTFFVSQLRQWGLTSFALCSCGTVLPTI